MPELPSPGKVIKLQIHWRIGGDLLALTNHYLGYTGGPPDGTTLDTIAATGLVGAQVGFAAMMPTIWGADACTTKDLSSEMGETGSDGTSWLGTATGAALAPATSTLINLGIQRSYRGGKPRSYIPCGTATDIASAGIWSSAHVTAATVGFNDFVGSILGTVGGTTVENLVNVSYYQGFTPYQNPRTHRWSNVPNLRTTPVVDVVRTMNANQRIATQKRRNRDA